MSEITEEDCFNAIEGRVIKSIGYNDRGDTELIIETQDGLKFRVIAEVVCEGDRPYLEMFQI